PSAAMIDGNTPIVGFFCSGDLVALHSQGFVIVRWHVGPSAAGMRLSSHHGRFHGVSEVPPDNYKTRHYEVHHKSPPQKKPRRSGAFFLTSRSADQLRTYRLIPPTGPTSAP